MPYIYKITNDINNKIYIGKTELSIEKRWKEHLNDYNKRRNEKRPLYNAMNKYGIEHFHIEKIEETNNPEEREKYWIEYYGSFKNGYNATIGGDGKSYIDRELVIKTYLKLNTCKATASTIGISKETVSKILKENNITITSIQEYQKKNSSKQVLMLSRESVPLKAFSSLSEAARYIQENNISKSNNVNGMVRHIGEVCSGKRKSAYGYKWIYLLPSQPICHHNSTGRVTVL